MLRGTAGIGISIEATFLGGKYRHLTKARAWVLLQKHHQMQYPLQESSVGQLARLKLSNRYMFLSNARSTKMKPSFVPFIP